MMHLRLNAPILHYSTTPLFLVLVLTMACDRLPGKPTLEERWKPATELTDFNQLYAQNCSGCHGADGRLGAARPLNDSLYLALVNDESLRQVIAQGVPTTAMPDRRTRRRNKISLGALRSTHHGDFAGV